jgi:hypothetical protein
MGSHFDENENYTGGFYASEYIEGVSQRGGVSFGE